MNDSLSSPEISILNYNKKALVLVKKDKSAALEYYLKAEQLLKTCPSAKLKLLTYNNLACFYEREKEYSKALSYLKQCCFSHDFSCKILYFGAVLNQASILSKLDRHEESLKTAIKILDEIKGVSFCLHVFCLYAVALEFEFLKNGTQAHRYYIESRECAGKILDKGHGVFKMIETGLKNVRGLKELVSFKNLTGAEKKKPKIALKSDYYIKVDTTPWIDQNSKRVKSNSLLLKNRKKGSSLRKNYLRLSHENASFNNSSKKLEEKIEFISRNLSNLTGKLNFIEKIYKKREVEELAVIKIQRAFKEHLRTTERKDLEVKKKAVKKGLLQSIIFIQKWIRGFLVRKRIKQKT